MDDDRTANSGAYAPLDTQGVRIDEYMRHARFGMLVAIGMHTLFGVVGIAIGAPMLAYLQVVSVAVYALTYFLSFRGHRKLIRILTIVDLLGHSTLASWIVGQDSGFHYYSWILLPLVFTSVDLDQRSRVQRSIVLCVLFLGIDWWLSHRTPLVQVSAGALDALRYFNIVCYLTATTMSALSYTRSAADAEAKLREAADTDVLTGLLNRRRMSDRMHHAWESARRSGNTVAVMVLDIDHFKSVNDRFGHASGDDVIVRVGDILRTAVRRNDLVSRWGGEEFLVLLPGATLASAREIAERVRFEINRASFRFDSNIRVSATIGLTTWRDSERLDETLVRADTLLYRGKRDGRNRVVDEHTSDHTYEQQLAG